MTTMTNHPGFRATNTTASELRALATEYGVEVEISGDVQHGFRLSFRDDYVIEGTTFEDACEEIRAYAS